MGEPERPTAVQRLDEAFDAFFAACVGPARAAGTEQQEADRLLRIFGACPDRVVAR